MVSQEAASWANAGDARRAPTKAAVIAYFFMII
jgi:hypothetical protein